MVWAGGFTVRLRWAAAPLSDPFDRGANVLHVAADVAGCLPQVQVQCTDDVSAASKAIVNNSFIYPIFETFFFLAYGAVTWACGRIVVTHWLESKKISLTSNKCVSGAVGCCCWRWLRRQTAQGVRIDGRVEGARAPFAGRLWADLVYVRLTALAGRWLLPQVPGVVQFMLGRGYTSDQLPGVVAVRVEQRTFRGGKSRLTRGCLCR